MVTKTSRKTTKIKLQLLWERGKKCGICGGEITSFDDLTVDHIFPIARGGKNVIENCQLAHKKCNVIKGDKI
ncbi:HNH endonuclease [Candidatus Saccharibacteria bacterium]|nr:HNH endonuclease [Candidatus Saccharibacteria bacterium]